VIAGLAASGARHGDPPPATGQRERAWALALADRAIAEAGARETRVAVSVSTAAVSRSSRT
jgi:hypothetical protein